MEWSHYGPALWMFFSQLMIVVMLVAGAGTVFMIGTRTTHNADPTDTAVRLGLGLVSDHDAGATQPNSRTAALEEYRNETLRRVDQQQREFHEFMVRLRYGQGPN